MKNRLISTGCTALALLLAGCMQEYGSVNPEAIQETLNAPRMAVTPFQPAWLMEKGDMAPLVETDLQQVRTLLQEGSPRRVPDVAYQTDDAADPLAQNRFYLYGSNAQCLGATLLEERVVMHDIELPEETEKKLYQVLRPYIDRIFR